MDRRHVAGAATGVATVLLMLAASSGPVRVWTTPPVDVGPSNTSTGPLETIATLNSVLADSSDVQPWGDFFAEVVGVLLIVVVGSMAVWMVRFGSWPKSGWRGVRERQRREITALPEVPERELAVDVDAARIALAGGSPRNAIVACWMQLEHDATAAGLPRQAAETSAEYVERVVVASSVDPAPIRELAALYREARFSRHELRDDHRRRALAALDRVETVLRRSVEVLT